MISLLHQALDHAAERHPEGEAVCFQEQSINYQQLKQRADCLASVLRRRGVKRGDRVGICMHKCLETVEAVYGIMKAGAVYVPIDPQSPVSRLSYIIQHCGIRQLISHEHKRDALRDVVTMDTGLEGLIGIEAKEDFDLPCIPWAVINDESIVDSTASSLDQHIIELDLAYIMYTSGSTGEPKGIMHTHRSGLSYALWAAEAYELTSADRIASHAPLHFDISTFDLFAGVIAASTIVIVPEAHMRLPASYADLLAKEKISVIFTVPFALVQLLLRGALERHDLSSLRWLIFGGEPFPVKHLRELMAKLPQARFSNIYGPAEVNGVTFHHVPTLPQEVEDPLPIGELCPFAQARVIDEDDKLLADNEVGEIVIRSPTMMQGYWQRPELNRVAFYREGQFANYEERFYRTGDLVKRRADGTFMFIGRRDRQVKIRGYRVELDELEAILTGHDAVEEAASYVVPSVQGNVIEAAVVMRANTAVNEAALQKYLRQELPSYAMPHQLIMKDDFPRTSSGKIDRRALQARAMSSSFKGTLWER